MHVAPRAWIALKVTGLLGVLLLSGYAIERLADRLVRGPGPSLTGASPTPPPGADDPLNRGILIEGGVLVRGSNHPGKSEDPASPFYTGSENPVRRVEVGGFWIQEHEVTNAEYRRFDATHEFPPGEERHPVVNVTWREALRYAASLGGRLPTEAEWELAAEGTENRTYPWGDSAPTCERAHYGDCEPGRTVAVMSYPDGSTPEGIYDLAGNVWEWVMPAWFEPGRTPVNDEARRMRGGSFAEGPFFLRASNRSNDFFGGYKNSGVGFRVAWKARD